MNDKNLYGTITILTAIMFVVFGIGYDCDYPFMGFYLILDGALFLYAEVRWLQEMKK